MDYIIIILLVIGFGLAIALGIRIYRWEQWKKQFTQEMSFKPIPATDYIMPRFVYENHRETTVYNPENGKVIGYRISPTLVINSHIYQNIDKKTCDNCLLNRLLVEGEEVLLFEKNLEAISAMREISGEEPINLDWFWVKKDFQPMIISFKENVLKRVINNDDTYPAILKY